MNLFVDYSQTYAANILSVAGLLVVILGMFHVNIVSTDLQFILGLVVNLIGNAWALYHRYKKGDVTPLGSRVS